MSSCAYTAFLTLGQHTEYKKTYSPWNTVPYRHMHTAQQESSEPWGTPGDLVLTATGRTSHLNPGRKKHTTDFTGAARAPTDTAPGVQAGPFIPNSSAFKVIYQEAVPKQAVPFLFPSRFSSLVWECLMTYRICCKLSPFLGNHLIHMLRLFSGLLWSGKSPWTGFTSSLMHFKHLETSFVPKSLHQGHSRHSKYCQYCQIKGQDAKAGGRMENSF